MFDLVPESTEFDSGSDNDLDEGAEQVAEVSAHRFGVPRQPVSALRSFAFCSFLLATFCFSATATDRAVDGGDRGLVEPGATVHPTTGDWSFSLASTTSSPQHSFSRSMDLSFPTWGSDYGNHNSPLGHSPAGFASLQPAPTLDSSFAPLGVGGAQIFVVIGYLLSADRF